ncbi:MAG: hypothetical protein P0Y59_06290 [Candidatus Sphingomonas phytovorans]|nr:hypothetical protein [Sphingomonas sp.]WEK01291.1 MAG: hypothetical protein P0Y59_06290 [Sphingomonas sp.]
MVESLMPERVEQTETPDPRIFCFERDEDDRAFETSVTALMGRMQEQSRQMFINEHNVLRMNHGANWVHSARDAEPDTTMHSISAEWTIPFAGIAENDLNLIAQTILPVNEEMERQFAQNIYGVMGAAAEKVGNVVDAKEAGSFALSMLEMFRKIEFGVDRDGNVSMPQIHVGPGMYERIVSEMQDVPPELSAEIERVKAEKIQLALDREVERKAKFKRASG